MKKKVFTGILGTVLALSMSMTAFAGQWQQDATGWWYQNDDGSYPASTWQWIDGNNDGVAESYCFNAQGYCLLNTQTPDGYTVNENGAWTVDGAIQTQAAGTQNTATEDATQSTNDFTMEIMDLLGTYTGVYEGKEIQATFMLDGDTVWVEVDYFLKDTLPPYKGNGLYEDAYNSFQFSGDSSLIFKDLISGESVYFVKN